MQNHWLLCTTFLPPFRSGAGANTLAFAAYLRSKGVDVSLLSFYGERKPYYEFVGMRHFAIGLPGQRSLSKLLFRVAFLFRFLWLVRRCCTVYVAGVMPGYTIALGVAQLMGKRVLFRSAMLGSDDPMALLRAAKGGRLWAIRWALRRVTGYVATNRAFLDSWHQAFPKCGSQAILTVQGVNTVRFAPASSEQKSAARLQLGIPDTHVPVLLSVGNLSRRKGYDHIFSALASVTAPFVYVVVGESNPESPFYFWGDGEDVGRVKALGRELLGERLLFAGYRADANAFFASADVYITYADQEGVPNALMEAMSSALPVVCRPVKGLSGWLLNSDNSVQCESEVELTAAIERLLAHSEQREQLALCARQTAVDHFSFDGVYQRIGGMT